LPSSGGAQAIRATAFVVDSPNCILGLTLGTSLHVFNNTEFKKISLHTFWIGEENTPTVPEQI
jgi:hypothetical protein